MYTVPCESGFVGGCIVYGLEPRESQYQNLLRLEEAVSIVLIFQEVSIA